MSEKKKAPRVGKRRSAGQPTAADLAQVQPSEVDSVIDRLQAKAASIFGAGSLWTLRGDHAPPEVALEVFSTGSISIDHVTGIQGFPRGRVVEVYGPESSGKTTVALQTIASAQRAGGLAAFVDAEHALDPHYAEALGVDLKRLLVSQPDSGEQALDIVEMLVDSGSAAIVVIDSVAALVPQAELDGDMGDSHMGLQARLMSQALRKLTGSISKSKTTVVFINQTRSKIGVMFGNPETTTGGNALKFYATIRLEIRRIGALKRGTEVIGHRTRVKIVKNKLAPPFRECEVDLLYGKGISREGEILDLGVALGVLTKSGSWYVLQEERLGQGRHASVGILREKPELRETLRLEILWRLRNSGLPHVESGEGGGEE